MHRISLFTSTVKNVRGQVKMSTLFTVVQRAIDMSKCLLSWSGETVGGCLKIFTLSKSVCSFRCSLYSTEEFRYDKQIKISGHYS